MRQAQGSCRCQAPIRSRYLVATRPLLPRAQSAFKGLAGLEAAYPAESGTAGELTGIIKAGYPAVAGLFGAHRYHHCREDDMRCHCRRRLRRRENRPDTDRRHAGATGSGLTATGKGLCV